MLPGKYEPGPVIEVTLRIYVNGIERPHLSASWEGNTNGALPTTLITTGDDIYSRTGSITWAPGTAVTTHPLAPIGENRWMPQHGDSLYIEAEVAGARFPRFTGYLGASTYSLTSDEVTTKITDGLGDALQVVLSVEPQIGYAYHYLRSSWVAMRALEQVGLGVLPPVTSDTVLQNSGQAGAVPAVGKFVNAGIERGTVLGQSTWDGIATEAVMAPRAGRDIMIYTRSAGTTEAATTIAVTFRDPQAVMTLTYNMVSKELLLHSTLHGGRVANWVLEPDEPMPPMAFKVNAVGTRVWLGRNRSVLLTGVSLPAEATVVSATGHRSPGIKVDYLTDWEDGDRRVRAMHRRPAKLLRSALEQERIPATRGFENVTAESIISTWCKATLATVWVDETGQTIAAARDRLITGRPAITDRVEEKVFAGAWVSARDGVRSKVIVKGQEVNRAASPTAKHVVYQPENVIELTPGQVHEIFYTYPDEIDVIGLDANFRPVVKAKAGIYDWEAFNSGTGSWWAISFENKAEPEGYRWTGALAGHEDISGTLEKLGQRTLKLTFVVHPNQARWIDKYYLITPSLATGLRFGNRAVPMPVVRATNINTWTDFRLDVTPPGPPVAAPPFVLESDWWLTRADAARVADSLAQGISSQNITFDSLAMLWDPRKQIGDSHILQASDENGPRWEAEYLLTGYRESWEGNVPSCSYDAQAKRVTDVRAGKTYADMAAAYATYAVIPSARTYGEIFAALPERSQ